MAQLEQMKRGKIVSQNIDGLHRKQVAKKWWTFMVIYMNVIAKLVVQRFLGKTICLVIGTLIVGQIRPAITLYEEGLSEEAIEKPFRPLLLPT